MFLIQLIFALFLALILGAVLTIAFKSKGPGENLFFFFLLLFLFIWAGGIWVYPVGPLLWGVHWVPFLFVALFIFFLLALVTTPPPRESTVELVDEKKIEAKRRASLAGISVFLWVLAAVMLAVILTRYFI